MICLHRIVTCEGVDCQAEEYVVHEAKLGELPDPVGLPKGWIEFREKQYCPTCRKEAVPLGTVFNEKAAVRMGRQR